MKKQGKKIRFIGEQEGERVNFKVEIREKESLLQRILNLFFSERTVTTWMDESEASLASNYLYHEIKKNKKQLAIRERKEVETLVDENLDAMVEKAAQLIEEATVKPKRKSTRKPKNKG